MIYLHKKWLFNNPEFAESTLLEEITLVISQTALLLCAEYQTYLPHHVADRSQDGDIYSEAQSMLLKKDQERTKSVLLSTLLTRSKIQERTMFVFLRKH